MRAAQPVVPVWEDVHVAASLAAQHALRDGRERAGDCTIGWKVSFGTDTAQRRYGISAPLIGFLSESSRVAAGGSCAIGAWTRPAVEPEIAVHLRQDVPAGADPAVVAEAIEVVEPAIEIIDVDGQLRDLEAVLAANVFGRAVVLGASGALWSAVREEDLRATLVCDGAGAIGCDDVVGALGRRVGEVIGHVADVLAATGAQLQAGQVVITGALIPPVPVRPEQRLRFELAPIGSTEVILGV